MKRGLLKPLVVSLGLVPVVFVALLLSAQQNASESEVTTAGHCGSTTQIWRPDSGSSSRRNYEL